MQSAPRNLVPQIFIVCVVLGASACTSGNGPKVPESREVQAEAGNTEASEPQGGVQPGLALVASPFSCPDQGAVGRLSVPEEAPVRLEGITNHFEGFGNFEGPVWFNDSLVFSNIAGGPNPPAAVIRQWSGHGDASVLVSDSGSNGLALDATGYLVAARHSDGSVTRLPLAGATEQRLVEKYLATRFNSPNDLSFAGEGRFYFTDPTWQAPSPAPQAAARAYVVNKGTAVPVGEAGAPENPNGIAQSLDGGVLYIGGVNGLYRYSLSEDGTTTGQGLLIQTKSLGSQTGIDGLGRDCLGNLYVTAHGDKRVVVLGPESQEIAAIDVPSAGGVTNVAFGGESGTTLFITSLGEVPQIHQIELGVVGFPY